MRAIPTPLATTNEKKQTCDCDSHIWCVENGRPPPSDEGELVDRKEKKGERTREGGGRGKEAKSVVKPREGSVPSPPRPLPPQRGRAPTPPVISFITSSVTTTGHGRRRCVVPLYDAASSHPRQPVSQSQSQSQPKSVVPPSLPVVAVVLVSRVLADGGALVRRPLEADVLDGAAKRGVVACRLLLLSSSSRRVARV